MIEYGDNLEAAKKNLMDDGALFHIEEMDFENLLKAILKEVNNEIT